MKKKAKRKAIKLCVKCKKMRHCGWRIICGDHVAEICKYYEEEG